MTNSEEVLFDRFITKKMSSDEAREFEQRLASDSDFSENYRETLAVHKLIEEAGRVELKKTLETFENETITTSSEKKTIPLWVKRSLPIAAILIAFFAVYQFGIQNRSLTATEVFESNFDVYGAPSSLRDGDLSAYPNWNIATKAYREAHYEEAITQFSQVETDVAPSLVSFYTALSAMSQTTPDYELALQNFDAVLETDNDYRQQASWYKALILLKMQRQKEASDIFEEIVKTQSFNFHKAEVILNLDIKN